MKGKIPLQFLKATKEEKCLIFKQNVMQIIEQLKIKRNKCKNTTIFFKEFSKLTIDNADERLREIDSLINKQKFDEAVIKYIYFKCIKLEIRCQIKYNKKKRENKLKLRIFFNLKSGTDESRVYFLFNKQIKNEKIFLD